MIKLLNQLGISIEYRVIKPSRNPAANGKRNGAQEYFETVFETYFKGIHSRISFRK